jgi:hypothetical protein
VDNAYRGTVSFSIDGQPLTMVFDWAALSTVKTELGSEDLGALLGGGDLRVLAKLTAIALALHHPDWTADRIFKASPPVAPLVHKITTAFNYAWVGPGGAGEDRPANPLKRIWRLMTRSAAPSASHNA